MPSRLRDTVTGLWDESFFHASVRSRLGVARRELKPFSVVLIAIGREAGHVDLSDETARRAAYSFLRSIRESDQACRLPAGRFGLLLESTEERGAVRTVERIRVVLGEDGSTIWAGVASYPVHALDAPGLMTAAEAALADAVRWSESRTEIALSPS